MRIARTDWHFLGPAVRQRSCRCPVALVRQVRPTGLRWYSRHPDGQFGIGSLLFSFDKAGQNRNDAILLPARKAFVKGKLKRTTTECDGDKTKSWTIIFGMLKAEHSNV